MLKIILQNSILLILILSTSILSYSQVDSALKYQAVNNSFIDIDERDSEITNELGIIDAIFNKNLDNDLDFSHESGYFTKEFNLQITLKIKNDDKIYYTTDGSVPTENSIFYEHAITISTPTKSSYSFEATVIRAVAFNNGEISSKIVSKTYLLDTLMADRYSFPVVSLITDPENLYNYDTGIYVKGANYNSSNSSWTGNYFMTGIEWERDIHIQYFTNDGELVIDQDAGVRIHGGKQRGAAQKSLRLYARSEYGENKFNYQLLPQKNKNKYKRFILRTSMGSWSGTIIKDQLSVALAKNIGLEMQDYRPVIVLLNGKYWGIQTIRDYMGVHHFSDKYGVNKDSVNICVFKSVHEGHGDDYIKVDNILNNEDVSIDSSYQKIASVMDIDNLIYYYNTEVYLNNYDWPGGNIRFWNAHDKYNNNSDRIKWMLFDLDAAFGSRGGLDHNMLKQITTSGSWPYSRASAFLFNSLITNINFKNNFIVKAAYLMNYYYHSDTIIPLTNRIKDEYSSEITEHLKRWGGDTYSGWESKINSVIISYAKNRRGYVEQHFISKFSLSGIQSLTLTVNDKTMGQIYINKLPIPYTNNTGDYFKDIPIEISAIPAYGYKFSHWVNIADSLSNPTSITLISDTAISAVFKLDTKLPKIVINELLSNNKFDIKDNYNENEDWLELYNNSDSVICLANYYLTDDVDNNPFKWQISNIYPDSVMIPANGFILFYLDNDPEQGVLHANFKLNSTKEKIALVKKYMDTPIIVDNVSFNQQIQDVSYGRVSNGADQWSLFSNTSPKHDNINRELCSGLYINEIQSSNSRDIKDNFNEHEDWIEIYNSNNYTVDIGGLFISDDISDLTKHRISTCCPDSTTLEPNSFMLFFADKDLNQGLNHLDFKLSSQGEHIFLSQVGNSIVEIINNTPFPSLIKNQSYGRVTDGNLNFTSFTNTTPNASNNSTSIYDTSVFAKIFPNPADNFLNIHIGNYNYSILYKYSIYNMMGNIIKSDVLTNQINFINISSVKSGLYVIKIEGDKTIMTKILIE